MASIVSVEQIKGLAGGSTPNTITIPSGQTLTAPGHVIQCLHTSTTATIHNTTTTFADLTGMTLTITPSATNSLIFISGSIAFTASRASNVDIHASTRLLRDSTAISGKDIRTYDYGVGGIYIHTPVSYSFVDQPSTTSAVVYKFQARRVAADTTQSTMNGEAGNRSEMVILEIAQ
tara:strand:- start:1336 stop:1863 length:528 start_codon:yes stop_codon:yes gene_type:complete